MGPSHCCWLRSKCKYRWPGVFCLTLWTPRGNWTCLLSFLLGGGVFIAWSVYTQKAPVKLCYYCSTKLEMLEVSASWLFHAAMNILWERKYLVSDSFYSAAPHRAGNLPDLTIIQIAARPALYSLLHDIHGYPASLRWLGFLLNESIYKMCRLHFSVLTSALKPEEPSFRGSHWLRTHGVFPVKVSLSVFYDACLAKPREPLGGGA